MGSRFRSEEGKLEILRLYEQKLNALDIEFEYLNVNTSFGETNIIATGDPKNPPALIVHGSNGMCTHCS